MILAHQEPEEVEPGHEAWSPVMGRLGRVFAWLILLMIALGILAMLWTIVFG